MPLNSIETSNIISQAKNLLSQNQLEKARDLLLEAGFTRELNPKVQEAFLKLIPVNQDLEAQLSGTIRQLQDPNPKVRRSAARRIRVEAMKEFTLKRKAWMADPRVTGPLIKALEDSNDLVVEEAAGALARVIMRYLPDLRAFDPLTRLLQSKKKTTRHYAVLGVGWLDRGDRWDLLAPFIVDGALEVRRAASRVIAFKAQGASISAKTKVAMREALEKAAEDKDRLLADLARNAIATLG